jgi:hypothetical protein
MLKLTRLLKTSNSSPVKLISILSAALLLLPSCSDKPKGTPSKEDVAALKKLYGDFSAARGHPAAQLEYIDPVSQLKYMIAHRELIRNWMIYGDESKLGKKFTFKPNVETAISHSDPLKYFSSFEEIKFKGKESEKLWKLGKVAAISLEGYKAYMVIEAQPAEDSGLSRPTFEIETAVRTDKGWRIDVTSTEVRRLQLEAKSFY